MLQILSFLLENLKVLAFFNNLEIYTDDKRKTMILRSAKIKTVHIKQGDNDVIIVLDYY